MNIIFLSINTHVYVSTFRPTNDGGCVALLESLLEMWVVARWGKMGWRVQPSKKCV